MKRMLINAIDSEESRIAVVEDGVLQELHVEIAHREAYLGNIYKGRVVNIEPSIGAAFVNFGGTSNGFLHVSDVLPAYGEEGFALEDVVEGRARVSGDSGPAVVLSVLEDEDVASSDEDTSDDEEFDAADAGDDVGPEAAATESDAEVEPVEGKATPEPAPKKRRSRRSTGGKKTKAKDERKETTADVEIDSDSPADPTADSTGDSDGVTGSDGAAEGTPDADAADGGGPERKGDDGDPIFFMAAKRGNSKVAEAEEVAVEPVEKRRSRGAPRRPSNRDRQQRVPIEKLLTKGQEVVVQVTKEGIGAKGPTLTTYVSLPGRCLVLMPSLPKCGVSRKIASDKERKRLKKIVRTLDETGKGGLGFIVRTAGVEKTKDELERDRDYLHKIWSLVAQRLKATRSPALLYQESDLVLKAMRDLFSPDIAEVVADAKDVFLRIKDFTGKLMPRMAERIKRHESMTPIFHAFGIEAEVQNLYQPHVELPNGISIVIDQTEALVAVDVNSGKFKPGTNSEETAYRTNLESIPEIARQLRLRDLGGVIIIDFIDMGQEKHRRGVERRLIDSMRGDKARVKIGKISPFGMMELTRQRVGPGLKRTVFDTCGHCDGAGLTRTVQSKALAVLRDARAILNLKGFSILQVYVAPPVSDYLVNYKRRSTLDLEEEVGKSVVVKAEPSYPVDVVHYRFLTADGQEAKVVIPAGLGVKL